MAINVIKPEHMGYNFGGELGQSTGRGLKKIVDSLIQKKQQEHESEQQRQAFSGIGYSPEQINLLSQFDPETQFKILQTYKPKGMNKNQGQPQGNELQQMLGSQQQGMPQENNIMHMLGGQQQQPQQDLNSPFSAQEGEAPFGAYQTPQMKQAERLANTKEKNTQQRHIDKQATPYITAVRKNADEARSQDAALDVLDELGRNPGKLNSATWETILDRFGLNKGGFLSSPESELYRAISSTFMGGAKNDIGGRVAVQEMQAWMKRVPTLLNSAQGRKEISEKWRILNKGKRLKDDITNRLIEYNNGEIPKNLELKANQIYDKEIGGVRKELLDSFQKNKTSFAKLPKPWEEPIDTQFKDNSTGKIYKTNGKSWIAVKGKNG